MIISYIIYSIIPYATQRTTISSRTPSSCQQCGDLVQVQSRRVSITSHVQRCTCASGKKTAILSDSLTSVEFPVETSFSQVRPSF